MVAVGLANGKTMGCVWRLYNDCGGCEGEEKHEYDRVGVGLHIRPFRLRNKTRYGTMTLIRIHDGDEDMRRRRLIFFLAFYVQNRILVHECGF